ncbi:putative linoleate 9S-lipoxygenase 5 [Dorcoceras hygrometricum]|uniref:Putative linoleate 9S-lipoxygenase 5 n=1 Tax=Dorcoceras hygrometricum TaxID=472368 RepID=A0A2Z7D0T2_9LAMI|nr:putative linoleate 9S-lipoxygenase 5 [Dorcoceras hygrometricum]
MTVLTSTAGNPGIQLAVDPQPLWLRNHNSGLAHRIMVKRLATSPHDPLGITDSACKNQLVVVSVQYGTFNPYIPIRSTTIGKSRVAIDPIAMHTSWRSNSDITSVTSIGYPRMSASGESSTTMHRLLHASGSHPIPTPYDPKFLNCYQSTFNGCHIRNPTIGLILSNPRLLIAKINRGDQQKSISRCLLFLSLKSAEEIKCCIRNYNLETIPFQLNETTPQRFTSRQQYILQRTRCWLSNSLQNPSAAGYAKITQNDDASTNLDDAVLDMPHRYQLLVNQQASILHNDSKPAVALNQTTSLRL